MNLAELSDDELLGKVEALSETERFSLTDLILHLGELDLRTACQNKGYASVFAYLTRRLCYSESDAIRRVRTARAARRFPSILRMLAGGELHLVSVALLEPVLTSDNHERLLRKAARRSTREVERLVAELAPPSAEPRDRIRPLPPPARAELVAPSGTAASTHTLEAMPGLQLAFPAEVSLPTVPAAPTAPIGPVAAAVPAERRVVFTFAASEQVQRWFEEARDLLRHRFPMGRMEEVVGEALRRLVEEARPAKPGKLRASRRDASSPKAHGVLLSPAGAWPKGARSSQAQAVLRSPEGASRQDASSTKAAGGRRIPKRVRDEVWLRDTGRCAFVSLDGVRCNETAWIEWDHIVPWALGGPSDDPANIRLLCRNHNQSEALRFFGGSRHTG